MCNCPVPCPGPVGRVVYRPCGKCLDCLRQYQQDWTCRLSEEVKAWKGGSVIFFTLTYAESMLPVRVTYNHPITLSRYSVEVRNNSFHSLAHRLSLLGLDSFYYTRPLKDNDAGFRSYRRGFQDTYLDIPLFERPAIAVPSVKYEDVNAWIRYCRKWFDRHCASVSFRDKRVSPYLRDLEFTNIHGVKSVYPDSAYTPSFKYWITSEYGPNTLRPHYHGILFGVSEDDFRDVFAPWWRKVFGDGSARSVEYSVFDPAKGGAMYIAKYSSKGSFDHPLVSKVKHYPSGKEYFSRNCINNHEWFDIDEPLCTPPFRLISKGIGVRYAFRASVQKYHNIQCDEFTGFVCKDSSLNVVPLSFMSQIDQGVTTIVTSSGELPFSGCSTRFEIERIESRKRPVTYSLSSFVIDPSLGRDDIFTFQNQIYNKKYARHYIYKGESKVYECLLPRYYRRFLLSPFAQVALNVVARVRSLDDFNRKREQVESCRSQDEKDASLRQMRFDEKVSRSLSQKEIAHRFGRFYGNEFKGDFESCVREGKTVSMSSRITLGRRLTSTPLLTLDTSFQF